MICLHRQNGQENRTVSDKRVCFDFEVDFSNGGGIQGQDFRLDINGDNIGERIC